MPLASASHLSFLLAALFADDAFQTHSSASEDAFKASTVGLVSAEQFKAKRLEIESAAKAAEEEKRRAAERERKRKGKEREKKLKALSFSMDEEEEAGGAAAPAAASSESKAAADSAASAAPADGSGSGEPAEKKRKLEASSAPLAGSSNKDPLADTSFLPDRAREAAESALRAQLAAEWKAEQEAIKAEQIQITYSYWDGSGHRRKIVVKKGTTIGQFLELARKDLFEHSTACKLHLSAEASHMLILQLLALSLLLAVLASFTSFAHWVPTV